MREYSYPVLSLPGENSLVRTLHCTTRDNKQILYTITTVTASLASKHLQNSLRMEKFLYSSEYTFPVLSLSNENEFLWTLHCTTTENKHRNPAVTTMTAFLTFKYLENSPTMKIINFLREYSYPVLSLPGGNSLVRTLHCTTIENKHRNPAITTMTAFLTFKHHKNSPTMKIINFLREYSYPVLSLLGENGCVQTLHCTTTENKHRNPAVTTMVAFKHHENSPTVKIINFLREYSYPVLSLPGENSLLRTLHCTTRDNKQILCTITTVTASLTSKHLKNSLRREPILRLERILLSGP